ncbi:hypothetical protein [Tsukamurella soli]|uniref:PH domain-containing protein n=1 Tax=Tsukamurella soli TaxID=644556 RepID=A0ABP8K9C5_9ACTN
MTVIASRTANALIEDVHVGFAMNAVGGPVRDDDKHRNGGLWVGSRVTITTTDVQFRPNAVNRSIQSGQLDITVDLRSIDSVDLLSGVLTRIVAVRTGDLVLKVRCFGAAKLAEQIRTAVSAARSAPQT